MYVGRDFDYSETVESEVFSFDFQNDLSTGETISSSAWTCTVISGTDISASSRLGGAPAITGTVVSHRLIGLVSGVHYRIRCIATTNQNNVISLHSRVRCYALTAL